MSTPPNATSPEGPQTSATPRPQETNGSTATTAPKRRIPRRKRKRLRKMPRPPVPMRALWESASVDDQKRAHLITVWMLEYWVGRMSKQETAELLAVTPLRVWQMSQMAVAGMVCGLLPQPRYRKGMSVTTNDPESDPKMLRKRIAKLEADLASAQRLIDILKTLPGHAQRGLAGKSKTPAGKKKESPASRRGSSSGQKASGRRK
jgi:hypothetical protein